MRFKYHLVTVLTTSCIVILSLSSFMFNSSSNKGSVSCSNHHSKMPSSRTSVAFGHARWSNHAVQHLNQWNQVQALFEKDWSEYALKTVVIDPGHGGMDKGTSSKDGIAEKNIALSIAKILGRHIATHYPDVKVIFTRKKDVFVTLQKRADIANKNKADLFLSIHCNSFKKSWIRGLETYVLGLGSSNENMAMLKRENDVVLLEEGYKDTYEEYGVDKSSPLYDILINSYQSAHLDQSLALAASIEKECKSQGLKTRGVHQAGFVVLYRTTMPSVLIETGYLSNEQDKQILSSSQGQQKIARHIFQAFSKYKRDMDTSGSQSGTTPSISPSVASSSSSSSSSSLEELNKGFQFVIQLASSQDLLDTSDDKWKKIRSNMYIERTYDGWMRYMLRGFGSNYRQAAQKQKKLVKAGFKDCFLVAYQNGKRVDLLWAKRTLEARRTD